MNTTHKPVQSNHHMISRPVTCRNALPSKMSFEYSSQFFDVNVIHSYHAVFTNAHPQILLRPVQFSSHTHPRQVYSNIISYLCARLLHGLIFQGFTYSHIPHFATCPTNLTARFIAMTVSDEKHTLLSSSKCNFHCFVTAALILKLCPCLEGNEVRYPFKNKGQYCFNLRRLRSNLYIILNCGIYFE
jgi:hypothetical protein